MLLKASSGERCAVRNFVLLATLRGTPHCVSRRVSNEIDYGK